MGIEEEEEGKETKKKRKKRANKKQAMGKIMGRSGWRKKN